MDHVLLPGLGWVQRRKVDCMLSPHLIGLRIPTSCISANYKVPSTKPDVTHPPLFRSFCVWRGRIIQIVTFYTGFVVTGRSICKPREALNKYLANLKACVLHAKRLSSSYDSFCFLVINTVLIVLAVTTAVPQYWPVSLSFREC